MSQLVLGEIDPSQPTCGQSQLSLGADKGVLTEANIRDQKMTCRPSSIPFPIAWDNSISLNLGVSEDSPKDTENLKNSKLLIKVIEKVVMSVLKQSHKKVNLRRRNMGVVCSVKKECRY